MAPQATVTTHSSIAPDSFSVGTKLFDAQIGGFTPPSDRGPRRHAAAIMSRGDRQRQLSFPGGLELDENPLRHERVGLLEVAVS